MGTKIHFHSYVVRSILARRWLSLYNSWSWSSRKSTIHVILFMWKTQIIDIKGFVFAEESVVLRFVLWKHNTVQQNELLFFRFKGNEEGWIRISCFWKAVCLSVRTYASQAPIHFYGFCSNTVIIRVYPSQVGAKWIWTLQHKKCKLFGWASRTKWLSCRKCL
jgi:hypothetical protein